MSLYSEKLKDPRWQKKRLEVFNRDGFACCGCKSTERTLNVHHNFYERDKEPWEYEIDDLQTLCDDCHDMEREQRTFAIDRLLFNMKHSGFLTSDIYHFSHLLELKPKNLSPQDMLNHINEHYKIDVSTHKGCF